MIIKYNLKYIVISLITLASPANVEVIFIWSGPVATDIGIISPTIRTKKTDMTIEKNSLTKKPIF